MAKRRRKRMERQTNGESTLAQGGRVLYDDVMALAGTLMRGQKQYGAGKISSLASATRDFADAMPEMPNLRVYVATAAERLEDLSDYVTRTDFEIMVDDAGKLARQYPMATLGIAIAAGLGATRLMHVPSFSRAKARPRRTIRSRTRPKRRAATNGNRAHVQ